MTGPRLTASRHAHRTSLFALALLLAAPGLALAQAPGDSPLLAAGTTSGLPLVKPNDNTRPAGALRGDGTRTIDLEVTRADWRVETPEGPGLRVAAIGETGGAPEIPAPLIRVETGTRVAVTVRNRLSAAVTVFGLQPHPAEEADSIVVAPGAAETAEFEAGAPGTYMYWMREGPAPDPESKLTDYEYEQLAGAFVVDPAGEPPDDRVLVMNIFSVPADSADMRGDWYEALTINGLSWPATERMKLQVGDRVRWRVVNASVRNHPMHLHGFFYDVLSRGTATTDTIYAPEDRRHLVTETMRGRTTMEMAWTPTRPGRWLFHCHLSFHVSPDLRLPGAADADPDAAHVHMAGLVTGIEVAPGPSDLVAKGPPRHVDLYALETPMEAATEADDAADDPRMRYAFAVDAGATAPDPLAGSVPGPVLAFQQYQPVDVTVHNELSVPTGVHWHGLEIDAWSDGVPDWSASAGKSSPVIQPGEAFTYHLSMMRPGTFIYHTHLNDIVQLTSGGLYGPLLVLPEGETYDPRTDHVLTWGWRAETPSSLDDVALNGRHEQPDGDARVGERHRFRVINIAPAGNVTAWITREDGTTVPITLFAKDGADLPEHQQVSVETLPRLFVGETADFTWTPAEPGTYELGVGVRPEEGWYLGQRWIVTE
ncbi:MAG: multicopper oxidase domain-containing protein [Gemmatimonadales bacterium]|jgi:FtsP/CotA-like multicopper oxidase with cupredoxin domain